MNQRLLISISISLTVHLLILCLLKLAIGLDFSITKSNPISLNVLLTDKKLSETSNLGNTIKSLGTKEEVKPVQNTQREIVPKVNTSDEKLLFNPEPQYYLIKELDQRPIMVSNINTTPLELSQFNQGGEVKIQVWIDEYGNVVKSLVVYSTLPQVFIDYTITSFSKAKFIAGIKDGLPVRSIAKVVVQYTTMKDQ